jgi:uncharacterized membrane protein (UPF0127 family)
MSDLTHRGFAFNRTRRTYLATELDIASTHWSRFCGLMARDPGKFRAGQGLWITPSKGVHTWGMRFPIDVLYLDREKIVVHLEQDLKPWHFGPVERKAASVLELPGQTVIMTRTSVGDHIEIALGQREKAQTT